MNYAKPPLTFEQQADQLINRGLQGDRALIIDRLASVNYYRLSGYWLPFREPAGENFKPGITFETVWRRYVFDRHLRLLVMDAIERIEIAVRTQLAFHHAHAFGNPFAYADDPAAMPGLTFDQKKEFLGQIETETNRSRESFVKHFKKKYSDCHPHLPVWMASEITSFGWILTFYRGMDPNLQANVAAFFGVQARVFNNWLLTLNTIRNICAHHGRLWNRELGIKPLIPNFKNDPEWHMPVTIPNNRVFGVLTICRYCLRRIAPQSHWADRVRDLLKRYPEIPQLEMGFPLTWEDCPIWGKQ